MNRITKSQFASVLNWATQEGRRCGALKEGEWFGTAVAWTQSYLCLYDADGIMVTSFGGRVGSTRELFERANAMYDAFALMRKKGE